MGDPRTQECAVRAAHNEHDGRLIRAHVLGPEASTREGLTRIYQRCIVYKLIENSRSEPSAGEVRVLRGLPEEDQVWCAGLLGEARRLLRGL